jgi:hypothetical protein
MKRATVYERRGELFFHSLSKTTAGVWILTSPYLKARSDDDEGIASNTLAVLDASVEGIAHPTKWTGLFDPILKMAGVKSWNTFAKSARCIEAEEHGETISVVPTRNLGVDEGFEPIASGRRVATRDTIAEAVRIAIQESS